MPFEHEPVLLAKERKLKAEKTEGNERNVRNGSAIVGGLSLQDENTSLSICAHLHMN